MPELDIQIPYHAYIERLDWDQDAFYICMYVQIIPPQILFQPTQSKKKSTDWIPGEEFNSSLLFSLSTRDLFFNSSFINDLLFICTHVLCAYLSPQISPLIFYQISLFLLLSHYKRWYSRHKNEPVIVEWLSVYRPTMWFGIYFWLISFPPNQWMMIESYAAHVLL